MKSLHRRIEVLKTKVATAITASIDEEPATTRWLKFLKRMRPVIEKGEATEERDVIVDRVRRSIAMLEEYESPPLNEVPHPYLEYYCQICIHRLSWDREWVGRELAFAEADYDEHMAEIEMIERGRFATMAEHVESIPAGGRT